MRTKVTKFKDDIKKGKKGEIIFVEDFLSFLGVKFKDVSDVKDFQINDTDFVSKLGSYEVKANYKDNETIIIEEYTNINEELGPMSMGWFYKTKADTLVFVSSETRVMVFIPFTEEFKAHYESIKEKYPICRNLPSERYSRMWQSAYRRVPLKELEGYYSFFQKK